MADTAVINCQILYYLCRSSLLPPITKIREIIFDVQYYKNVINNKNDKSNRDKWWKVLGICLHTFVLGSLIKYQLI